LINFWVKLQMEATQVKLTSLQLNLWAWPNKEIQSLKQVDQIKMTEVSNLDKMKPWTKELQITLESKVLSVSMKKHSQSRRQVWAGKNLRISQSSKFCSHLRKEFFIINLWITLKRKSMSLSSTSRRKIRKWKDLLIWLVQNWLQFFKSLNKKCSTCLKESLF
jgi:hypothetical protein